MKRLEGSRAVGIMPFTLGKQRMNTLPLEMYGGSRMSYFKFQPGKNIDLLVKDFQMPWKVLFDAAIEMRAKVCVWADLEFTRSTVGVIKPNQWVQVGFEDLQNPITVFLPNGIGIRNLYAQDGTKMHLAFPGISRGWKDIFISFEDEARLNLWFNSKIKPTIPKQESVQEYYGVQLAASEIGTDWQLLIRDYLDFGIKLFCLGRRSDEGLPCYVEADPAAIDLALKDNANFFRNLNTGADYSLDRLFVQKSDSFKVFLRAKSIKKLAIGSDLPGFTILRIAQETNLSREEISQRLKSRSLRFWHFRERYCNHKGEYVLLNKYIEVPEDQVRVLIDKVTLGPHAKPDLLDRRLLTCQVFLLNELSVTSDGEIIRLNNDIAERAAGVFDMLVLEKAVSNSLLEHETGNLPKPTRPSLTRPALPEVDWKGRSVSYNNKVFNLRESHLKCIDVLVQRSRDFLAGKVQSPALHQREILKAADQPNSSSSLRQLFRREKECFDEIIKPAMGKGLFQVNFPH